jgi:hypothetical protein
VGVAIMLLLLYLVERLQPMFQARPMEVGVQVQVRLVRNWAAEVGVAEAA